MLAAAPPEIPPGVLLHEGTRRPYRELVQIPLHLAEQDRRLEFIDERRRNGHIIPEEENAEEFDPRPDRWLGWLWVYNPAVLETQQERKERYLADTRLVGTKGYARAILRAYRTVKSRKTKARTLRLLQADDVKLTAHAVELARADNIDLVAAKQLVLQDLEKQLDDAMPVPRGRIGHNDVWYVRDALKEGRNGRRLNEWYTMNSIRGRPVGSTTRRRSRPV